MEEIKRTLMALQTSDKYDVLTPANWSPGKDVMVKSSGIDGDTKNPGKTNNPGVTTFPWYMCFKKLP